MEEAYVKGWILRKESKFESEGVGIFVKMKIMRKKTLSVRV